MAFIILMIGGTLYAALFSIVRAALFCVPLMIVLHFLHNYIPLVPQLGWVACFLLLVAVSFIFTFGGSTTQVKA